MTNHPQIDEGPFGVIKIARLKSLNLPVAVKYVKDSAHLIDREIHTMLCLQGPDEIPRLFGVLEPKTIVMELIGT